MKHDSFYSETLKLGSGMVGQPVYQSSVADASALCPPLVRRILGRLPNTITATVSLEKIIGAIPIVVCVSREKGHYTGDTWRVAFNRASFLGDRRGNEAWLAAVWPGDGDYKRAVQQSMLPIPRRLVEGKPQIIDFPKLENQKCGVKNLRLKATSDSGLPVRFFVREGPAEVAGDTVTFTVLPPRTRFPVKVTIGAYQFGKMSEPKFQSATPVFQEFFIEHP